MKKLILILFLGLTFVAPIFAAGEPTVNPLTISAIAGVNKVVQLQGNQIDGHALSYTILSGPSHGTVTNFNSGSGVFIYTATLAYSGADAITYKVTANNTGGTPSDTFKVTSLVVAGEY